MSEINSSIATLQNLLDFEASKFISAEIELKRILPEWIKIAGSLKLKNVLQKYQDLVEQHVQMMEAFYEEEKITLLSIENRITMAYIHDAEDKLKTCSDSAIKDSCLLASIQSINHFKISMYGTAAAFAKTLSLEKAASVFHGFVTNEKQIDDRLSQLAEYEINSKAKSLVELSA